MCSKKKAKHKEPSSWADGGSRCICLGGVTFITLFRYDCNSHSHAWLANPSLAHRFDLVVVAYPPSFFYSLVLSVDRLRQVKVCDSLIGIE